MLVGVKGMAGFFILRAELTYRLKVGVALITSQYPVGRRPAKVLIAVVYPSIACYYLLIVVDC